ncbi:hypothetical protein CIHG_03892 [Coccidioides immitis H538.4]|uniref:Uncharacterized protein n=1 Tax=Coccidioides immitis H538.4 TaxID=396776 RepID=A0A0J8RQ24_COCIT|nr:hypothetical protein CIHG_03892 [Coccidioides immitis H538.4]
MNPKDKKWAKAKGKSKKPVPFGSNDFHPFLPTLRASSSPGSGASLWLKSHTERLITGYGWITASKSHRYGLLLAAARLTGQKTRLFRDFCVDLESLCDEDNGNPNSNTIARTMER